MISHLPILIVGAGPTGLMMACELARFGIPFRIIDKLQESKPGLPSQIQHRTLEIFDHIGILNRFPQRVDENGVLTIPRHDLEKILTSRLEELKRRVDWSQELIDIKLKGKSIEVLIRDNKNRLERVTCNWLIACDGSNSTIRNKWITPACAKIKMSNIMRAGQIFLAGGAALIKDFQDRDINLGLQDAYNLAWKMALVVRNSAKASIIESYEKERQIHRMVGRDKPNLNMIKSPLIDNSIKLSIKMPRQGMRIPNVIVDTEQTLYDFLRNSQHNILVFINKMSSQNINKIKELQNWAAKDFPHLIRTHIISKNVVPNAESFIFDHKQNLLNQLNVDGNVVYIIRPDTYIAYASHNFALNPIKKFFNKFAYAKN